MLVIPVVDASGTDMSRAERVTVVNDICVLAPGVLPFADAVWEEVDARRARAVFHIDGQAYTSSWRSARTETWSTSCPTTAFVRMTAARRSHVNAGRRRFWSG